MKKTIAFDLSSGDKGSTEAIKAAVDFSLLNKDWKILGFLAGEINVPNKPSNLEIINCSQIIEMTDGPLQIMRKKDSTLVKAVEAVVNGEASGVVSAAASGPLVTAGYTLIKPIDGTKPAFASIFRNYENKPIIALDLGANVGADAKTIEQYAIMGKLYSEKMNYSKDPIVKQLNIGEEDKKGGELQIEVFKLLSENKDINFKGNVEADNLLLDNEFDVVVTDAYSGNVALKSIEGTLKIFKKIIKNSVNKSFSDKLGFGLFTKKFKKQMRLLANGLTGGAVVLGLNELLLKSHGGSNSETFMASLETAKLLIENNLVKEIKEAIK